MRAPMRAHRTACGGDSTGSGVSVPSMGSCPRRGSESPYTGHLRKPLQGKGSTSAAPGATRGKPYCVRVSENGFQMGESKPFPRKGLRARLVAVFGGSVGNYNRICHRYVIANKPMPADPRSAGHYTNSRTWKEPPPRGTRAPPPLGSEVFEVRAENRHRQ